MPERVEEKAEGKQNAVKAQQGTLTEGEAPRPRVSLWNFQSYFGFEGNCKGLETDILMCD